ncbi:hypothetical protein [Citricoccus sp. I39-566]|uniref:hypothetical protein n=1 Tax=Citricoccus sp. I39-566 TaxID=3073268 RepID=UPI00286C2964|nr:hypothetical protein [Citricoccus sp. I39-566]WMY79404.1 hypothetical protein RE421_05940 [Citricoccus sp. I39-566]
MEYLIPLLLVVLVAVLVGGVAWLLARRSSAGRGHGAAGAADASGRAGRPRRGSLADRVSADSARAASTRLDQEAHREVYRLIAAGRTAEAITAYRRSTGAGTFEAMMDIQALATYPQVWAKPASGTLSADGAGHPADSQGTTPADSPAANGSGAPGAGDPALAEDARPPASPGDRGDRGDRVPPADIADATDLVVPEDWLGDRLPADRPFELEVVRDETTVRVSSDDLPPFLRDQLTALVRDGRVEDAALELSAHTVLTAEEALQFLHILQREQGQDD